MDNYEKVDRVIDLIINLISEEFAELYDSGETSKIWNGLKQECKRSIVGIPTSNSRS